MVVLIVSLLLALVAAAGMAFTLLTGGLTVDTLFFTLILLVMFLLFAGTALYELHAWRKRRAGGARSDRPAPAASKTAPADAGSAKPPAPVPPAPSSSELLYSHAPQRTARTAPAKPALVEGLGLGNAVIREAALSGTGIAAEPLPGLATWRRVPCDSMAKLERPLHEAGFEIFLVVGSLEASAFGFSRKRAVLRALGKVLARVEEQGHNAVEIARVQDVHLSGLFYATVVVNVRHVQAKSVMLGTSAKHAVVARHPALRSVERSPGAPSRAA